MKGQAAVNTTRDYIRAAVFFANTAILLTTFSVGFTGVTLASYSITGYNVALVFLAILSLVTAVILDDLAR